MSIVEVNCCSHNLFQEPDLRFKSFDLSPSNIIDGSNNQLETPVGALDAAVNFTNNAASQGVTETGAVKRQVFMLLPIACSVSCSLFYLVFCSQSSFLVSVV